MKTYARVALAAALVAPALAHADAVTDWNIRANDLVVESKLGTPPAMRVMALVQAAVYEAVQAAPAPSREAAIAAANRGTLLKLLPAQQALVERAYQGAIAALPENVRAKGIEAGERAAAAVLAARLDDGAGSPVAYRPHAAAGAYVPTSGVAVPHWGNRKPWLMKSGSQFRPAPPPALDSALWVKDFNEVKLMGARASTARTAEQTAIGEFWEYSLPPIYHGVLRSYAARPTRDLVQNARLFAAATQAMDDALIAVFDAKYHYNFWRPVTAVRNADADGNPGTERDAAWTPLHEAPLHPEYPSGHSILAGALAEVLAQDVGGGRLPELSTSSPSAKNVVRKWSSLEAFVQEVSNARIWEGIHFRTATEIGAGMGRKIGALAGEKFYAH